MAKSYSLTIGGSKVKLSRSDTQIAIRPNVGMARSLDGRAPVDCCPRSRRTTRPSGRIRVHIQASPQRLSRARSSLREAPSVDQELPSIVPRRVDDIRT
jgi:hypothetical protein